MERQPMVSHRMGATNSVLDKFRKLDDDSRLQELKQDLEGLLLEDLVVFEAGSADRQVKTWMKQVREVIYDIEDWVDLLSHNTVLESEGSEPTAIFGIAEQIEMFKTRISDARERCKRYNLLNKVSNSRGDHSDLGTSKYIVDPHMLHREKPFHIKLDEAEQELTEHLTNDDKGLKVVSIFGTGGLGKSTLAKKIYKDLKAKFENRAFVHVGRDQSIRGTLVDIYNQLLKDYKWQLLWNNEEGKISANIWQILQNKRYLIVLSDLRSIRIWNVISSAFPDNNLGSRILITTDIGDIASSCSAHCSDIILRMKVLTKERSESLFFSRIYIPRVHFPVYLSQVTEILLKMCGGLPLAVIVTAGLMNLKCAELSQFGKSIRPALDKCSAQGIQNILHISYTDLSLPLKSCFLYLSTFPDNYTIKKDHLIWRWIVEGLIPKSGKERLWETGEKYFHELISRRLIQPVFSKDDDELVGCTVHGVIRGFIEGLSKEENYFTWHEDIRCMPRDVIRRFSINYRCQKDEVQLESIAVHLSKVRSLALFRDVSGIDLISKFRFLRVLDLAAYVNLPSYHLLKIGGLLLLKYLRLACPNISDLRSDIGEAQHMEILDIRGTRVKALPPGMLRLVKLVCLYTDCAELHAGTGNMLDLEEVSTISVSSDSSIDRMSELVANSKQLKVLGVRFADHGSSSTVEASMVTFLNEIGKSDLQSLFLEGDRVDFLHLLLDGWFPPRHLRKFELTTRATGVPQMIASLDSLTNLHITLNVVETEGLRLIGDLPNLVVLTLFAEREMPVTSKDGAPVRCLVVGFRSLEVLWIKKATEIPAIGLGLQFTPGAMPRLRRLRLEFNARGTMSVYGDFDFGLQHLSCLLQIDATIWEAPGPLKDAAEHAIREQISKLPNRPKLKFRDHRVPLF